MNDRKYSRGNLSGFRRDYLNDSSSSPNDSSESPHQHTNNSTPVESRAHNYQQQMHTSNVISQSSAVGPSKLLAQEIHDEFLVCKICLDIYKNPKCLNCLHTFCEDCIENHISSETTYKKFSDYRDFTCPLCRKRTQLPVGGVRKLPDNFLVSSLAEMVSRKQRNTNSQDGQLNCEICMLIAKRTREAHHRCLECNKLLCKQCVEMHQETKVTKDHSIFGIEIEKDIICRQHETEIVRFYCEPCQTCICVMCTFNEHRDHEVSSFNEAVVKYKSDLEYLLDECEKKIEIYETNMNRIEKTEKFIAEAKQKIRDLAIDFIAKIRQSERSLLDQIQSLYGEKVFELIGQKSELQSQLEELKKTCSLTEVILRGKDMELLLLKKDLQEKFNMLTSNVDQPLPANLDKAVVFTAGHMELGILDDLDMPVEKRKHFSYKLIEKATDQATQTECQPELPEKLVATGDKTCQTESKTYQSVGVGDFNARMSTEERGINTRSRCVLHPTGGSTQQQAVVSIVPVMATPPIRADSVMAAISTYCPPPPPALSVAAAAAPTVTTKLSVDGDAGTDKGPYSQYGIYSTANERTSEEFNSAQSHLEMSTNEKLMRARQRRRMNEILQAQNSLNSADSQVQSHPNTVSPPERDNSSTYYLSGARHMSADINSGLRSGSGYYGSIY